MPTLFDMLQSEVITAQRPRSARPRWAKPKRDEDEHPFRSAPVERETIATIPPGGVIQGSTDEAGADEARFAMNSIATAFPSDQFDSDPIGAISTAEKGGFFDALQNLGAGMMMMSGDKDQSRLGLGLMQGQQRAKQFQQREKRLSAEATIREKRLQEQAQFSRGIQAADLRLKESKAVWEDLANINAEPDPIIRRKLVATRAAQLSPTGASLLLAGNRDEAAGRELTAFRWLSDKLTKTALQGAAGVGPEKAITVFKSHYPTIEHAVAALAQRGEISPDMQEYVSRNPSVLEKTGQALGWPATEAVRKAEEAKLRAAGELEGKVTTATGKPIEDPTSRTLAQNILSKPGVSIDMGAREMDKVLAKREGKLLEDLDAGKAQAAAQKPHLDTIRAALRSDQFKFGTLADARVIAGRVFETAGIDASSIHKLLGGASTAETFDSAVNSLFAESVKDLSRPMKLSLTGIQKSLPQLFMTPQGVGAITQVMERVNAAHDDRYTLAEKYINEHGSTRAKEGPSLRDLLLEYDQKNPIIDDETRDMIESLASAGRKIKKPSDLLTDFGGGAGGPEVPEGMELVSPEELEQMGLDPNRRIVRPKKR